MRKQELIHLHALCLQVRRHVETHRDVSADAFSWYEASCTGPTEIHRGKGEHEEALLRLLAELAAAIDGRPLPDRAVSDPVSEG